MGKLSNQYGSMAIKLGIKRVGATKTREMGDYFKEITLFAKTIENLASSIKNDGLAKTARQYKIAMKKIYGEYQKTVKNVAPGAEIVDSGTTCRRNMAALAVNLAQTVRDQAQNMLELYNMAYNFSSILNGSTISDINCKLEAIPSVQVNFNNLIINKQQVKNLLSRQINMNPPKYTPPPVHY